MIDSAEAPAPPRVLVVDDEDTVLNLLSVVVGRAGGRADVAKSAARARELLDQTEYACALFDKNLPDASGIELLRYARERRPRTEVLIITGYANMESAIEALRLGAFDYIVKPFDVLQVAHRLQIALERRRMRDELDALVGELRIANATLAESRQEIKRAYLETVLRLSLAAEYKDEAATDHVRRLSRYAGILARAVDATETWVENIVYAAPLHDIGNIGVPDAILRKPGPLTATERTAMRAHVTIGARILEGTTSDVLALAREIILTHHERWDGQGYPDGLSGNEIPQAAAIVAVADSFDAMTSDRPYRPRRSVSAAIQEIIACSGRQFSPEVAEAMVRLYRRGTLYRLLRRESEKAA